jgi:hypothetical protein
MSIVALLFFGLLAFQAYVPDLAPGLFVDTPGKIVQLLSQVYVLTLIVAAFLVWVLYYLNIQIVTNIRIVDIDQYSLFHRTISELHINQIEDVTSETKGVIATIFQFGYVFVQTAGTRERFEFDRVARPEEIEKLILELYEKRPHPTDKKTE